MLGGKAYLNQLIKNCLHLSEQDLKTIIIPFVQIMGFEAVISGLRIVDKGLYTKDLARFSFPTTKKGIRTGGMQAIIKAFSLVNVGP